MLACPSLLQDASAASEESFVEMGVVELSSRAPPRGLVGQTTEGVQHPKRIKLTQGAQERKQLVVPLQSSQHVLEDCSSAVAEEEQLILYQSPLSQDSAGPPWSSEAGRGVQPQPLPPVSASLQPALVCDADLMEMLGILRDIEAELQPSASYLEDQHGSLVLPELYLDASMRRTAVSWLVEVCLEFGLHQETLFLGISLLDRFLSASKGVPRTQLQLVAVACMLIASKHEEEMHPSVLDFTSIADNCFTPGDLLRMEAIVLDCLSFRINTPTAHTFLSMYKQALNLQPRTCALASYLAEVAMLEYELLHCRPSKVAAAASLLAQLYLGDVDKLSFMPLVTTYSIDVLKPCARQLLTLQRAAHAASNYTSPYLAVRDKYNSHDWICVSRLTPFDRLPSLPNGRPVQNTQK